MGNVDPLGANVITSALGWIQTTLLGALATTLAVMAIASIGLLMLTGRIDVRRAARVAFGCFIIFGASTIASGIMGVISGTAANPELAQAPRPPDLPAPQAYPAGPATPYDPYAGAALPPR